MDAYGAVLFVSSDPESWSSLSSELLVSDSLQEWAGDPDTSVLDSETEDVLQGVDPNQVFLSRSSDSEETAQTAGGDRGQQATPPQSQEQTTVLQVVDGQNIISIQLESWSQLLLSDSCVVNELVPGPDLGLTSDHSENLDQLSPELTLTEEEQKLLDQEGVSLPRDLPLTKAEERILKRVRRKIRNKQSAQDSRRRRKEYIDSLENRAAACSAQNKELQRTVEQLEKNNMSLMQQLRQLQSLIKRTASKGAQTSTCLLIIIVSLALIVLPSFSPYIRRSAAGDDYRPIGVISRNILTDNASSQSAANEDAAPSLQADSDASQSEAEELTAADVSIDRSQPSPERLALQTNQSEPGLALVAELNQSEPGLAPVAGQTSLLRPEEKTRDKPAHADEM